MFGFSKNVFDYVMICSKCNFKYGANEIINCPRCSNKFKEENERLKNQVQYQNNELIFLHKRATDYLKVSVAKTEEIEKSNKELEALKQKNEKEFAELAKKEHLITQHEVGFLNKNYIVVYVQYYGEKRSIAEAIIKKCYSEESLIDMARVLFDDLGFELKKQNTQSNEQELLKDSN